MKKIAIIFSLVAFIFAYSAPSVSAQKAPKKAKTEKVSEETKTTATDGKTCTDKAKAECGDKAKAGCCSAKASATPGCCAGKAAAAPVPAPAPAPEKK